MYNLENSITITNTVIRSNNKQHSQTITVVVGAHIRIDLLMKKGSYLRERTGQLLLVGVLVPECVRLPLVQQFKLMSRTNVHR